MNFYDFSVTLSFVYHVKKRGWCCDPFLGFHISKMSKLIFYMTEKMSLNWVGAKVNIWTSTMHCIFYWPVICHNEWVNFLKITGTCSSILFSVSLNTRWLWTKLINFQMRFECDVILFDFIYKRTYKVHALHWLRNMRIIQYL